MCEVEATGGARALRSRRDARQIKGLAGAVLHTWPEHHRDLVTPIRQQALQRTLLENVSTGRWRDFNHGIGGVSMPFELAHDGVPVR